MKDETRKLLLSIAKCEELGKAKQDAKHPCHEIVHYQDGLSAFQIPEPWNGDIENAKILFISSNPSIDMKEEEEYPTMKWDEDKKEYDLSKDWNDDNQLTKYFEDRLKSDDYLKRMKSEKKGNVQYWSRSRMVAAELLDMDINNPELEKKYCYTEIVHCKSKEEKGVAKAKKICFESTKKIIELAQNAEWIVIVGSKAKDTFNQLKKKNKNDSEFIKRIDATKVIYTYAPSAWGRAKPKPEGVDKITREVYIEKFIRPQKNKGANRGAKKAQKIKGE